jgi:signal transduction histidine kinase
LDYAQKFYTREDALTSIVARRKSLHRVLQTSSAEVEQLRRENKNLRRLAAMGTAASMILHEVNNLLTPVGTSADLALRHPEDKMLAQKALHRAQDNCERAAQVTQAVLDMFSGNGQKTEQVRVASVVDAVFGCLCRDFSKDGITVKKDVDAGLTVLAAPVTLGQVIMNLILNAREALLAAGGGMLSISARNSGGLAKITVSDTGCGMDRSTVEKIFEPFFTTKREADEPGRSGTGLGLALCKRVVDELGGTICAESEPGAGSTFTVTLPRL